MTDVAAGVGRTMCKCHQRPESVKNDGGAYHPVNVQFSEKLHGCYPPLIVLVNIQLQGILSQPSPFDDKDSQ